MRKVSDQLFQRKFLPTALIACTLLIGILIGTIVSDRVGAAPEGEPVSDASPLVVPKSEPVENQFSEIARRVRPSVVNIQVESPPESGGAEQRRQAPGRDDPSNMEDFFRRFFGSPPNLPNPRRRGPGEGSGVIVDPKGYIITNHHVVADAGRIHVRFVDDEKRYEAKVIGADEETDLAVIYVAGKENMKAAPIGNSDVVNVGDWAIAIGSPFGYRETVTVGIISAKSREVNMTAIVRPFQKFLQTDAAINPGNSGGPLLNARGEIIGINTAIISRTGGYDGLGFALASNIAVDVYNQIIKYGRVARGSIGIEFSSVQDPALLRTYGAKQGGVFVSRVVEDGPADKAGMEAEDIITRINGVAIQDGDHLIEVVAATGVGSTVPVDLIRGGKTMTVNITIADREKLFSSYEFGRGGERQEVDETRVEFGITVKNLTESMRRELNYDEDYGVLITAVEPASFGADIGLAEGDIIVAMNRRNISSAADIRDIRESLEPGGDVAFKVMRRESPTQWRTLYPAGVLPKEK